MDFCTAQVDLAMYLKIQLRPLSAVESENVQILNLNRNAITNAFKPVFGDMAEKRYYEFCAAILRARFMHGFDDYMIQMMIDMLFNEQVRGDYGLPLR